MILRSTLKTQNVFYVLNDKCNNYKTKGILNILQGWGISTHSTGKVASIFNSQHTSTQLWKRQIETPGWWLKAKF